MQNDTIGACEAVGISENGNLGAGTITPVFSDSDPLSELLQMAEDARRWRQLREKLDQHRRIEFHIGKVIVPELKDDVWGAARRDGYYGAFGQTLGGGGDESLDVWWDRSMETLERIAELEVEGK